MTTSRLTIFAAHALAWAIALPYLCGQIATYDLWAYLAQGELTWRHGAIPRADTLSYLPTQPWVCHYWLTSALTYPLFMAGGGAAARALTYAAMFGAVLLACRTARREGAGTLVTLLVTVLAIPVISTGGMPFRPGMMSFVFVALLIAWLQCGRAWWWMPLLFVLWTNLHAGVTAGLLLLGLHTAGSLRDTPRFKQLAALTAVCAAATFINPYHYHYWQTVWELLGDPNKDITEWQPVKLLDGRFLEFKILVPLTFAILLLARERDPRRWLVLAVFALAGFKQVRQLPLFGLAAIALLPAPLERALAPLRERWGRFRVPILSRWLPRIGLVLAAMILVVWIHSEPLRLRVPGRPNAAEAYYPVGGVEFIKLNNLRGNLAVFFPWGEYAEWKLRGQCRTSADGRHVTVFTRDAVNLSLDFSLGRQGWRRLLVDYPTDFALVPRNKRIEARLAREPGWTRIYGDPACALFARSGKAPGDAPRMPARTEEGEFP